MTVIYVDKEQRKRDKPFTDLSVWSLLFSNLAVITWALLKSWGLTTIMWVYWIQSASIGLFWLIRILMVNYYVAGLQSKVVTVGGKVRAAGEFLAGYGAFHLVLGGIIWFHLLESNPLPETISAAGVFILNGFLSLVYTKTPVHKKQDLRTFTFFPMARIIPIHLTIFSGIALRDFAGITFGGKLTILLFMLLKTSVDVAMYLKQRKLFN